MKRTLLILFSLAQVGLVSETAHAVNRLVTYFGDGGGGSLRLVIQGACEDPGDDVINFVTVSEVHIALESPLKIPAWCDGKVTINGLPGVETILNGAAIPPAVAFQEKAAMDEVPGILQVMTAKNEIRGLTFVGFKDGAGITLMGHDNLVEDNFFGIYRKTDTFKPNRFGMVISGDGNTITKNTLTGNDEEGILMDGHDNVIQGNLVGTKNGLCPLFFSSPKEDGFSYMRELIYLASSSWMPMISDVPEGCGNGGSGVQLVHHASGNVIGGESDAEGNTIVYNEGDGITLMGDGTGNFHSRNVIAGNQGLPVNINWDSKINKGEKYVVGTNAGIPTLDFTATPLDLAKDVFAYRLTGKGVVGATAEIYLAPADGQGALAFLEAFVIPESPFSHDLADPELSPGRVISALVCDEEKNCSELSSVALDRDVDHDGLLDSHELEKSSSSCWHDDTDGDGLEDSLEDTNLSGKQDAGETASYLSDTDDDGLSDFVETGGDGKYDPQLGDTDPLNSDTDGDGLADGEEDKNYDGIIQLGESSPLE